MAKDLEIIPGLKTKKFKPISARQIQEASDKFYREKLKDCHKDKEKLILPMLLRVIAANYSSQPIKLGNGVCGPGYFETLTGYFPVLSLKVAADYHKKGYSMLKELEFSGFSFIQSGDLIRAYIPAYEEVEGRPTDMMVSGKHIYETFYKKRDLKEKEEVFKIEKLDLEGRIQCTFERVYHPKE